MFHSAGPNRWCNMALNILIRSSVLLGLAFIFAVTGFASMKQLQMTVGESSPIEFPAGTELKISKKGVIDVFLTNDTTWQLTALRPGLVIIDAIESSTGSPLLPRLFIDVKSASKAGEPSIANRINLDLPDWVCGKQGIKCDRPSGIITGKTADWQWYMRTISLCHSSRQCWSFIELSEKAAVSLQGYFQTKLGSTFSVKSDPTGNTKITSICDAATQQQQAEKIDQLLPGILEKHIASFSCAQSQETYEVRIRARRVSTTSGSTIGYKAETTHQIAGLPLTSTIGLKNSLVNESLSSQGEIMGEPMFLASEEVEFHALVGGELPYLTPRDNGQNYQWKEYGLSVKGKIKGIQGGRVRTHLDLFLKSLNDQASGSLSTSSLKSSVDTAEGIWTLVGELDLHSSSTNLRETPFFVRIPIIGPFFQLMSSSKDKSKLQVWMQVRRSQS